MGLWHVEEHYGKNWFPLWGADEREDSAKERGAFGEAAFGWGLGREETEKQEERKRKEQLRENRERGVAVFREDKRGFPGKLIMIFQSFFFLIIIIYPLSSCCFWVLFASLSVDTPIVWFLLILWDESRFIITVFFCFYSLLVFARRWPHSVSISLWNAWESWPLYIDMDFPT